MGLPGWPARTDIRIRPNHRFLVSSLRQYLRRRSCDRRHGHFDSQYLLPLPFYGLELFVAFMQAFIFSVLTLVFMSLGRISHTRA